MRSKLLAAAIVAGLSVTSLSAAADPQQATISPSELAQLKAQIAALQAKVASLEDRTDAQSDINVSQAKTVEAVQKTQADTDKFVADAKAGKLDYKGVQITLGGFVEAATIYRSVNENADMASSWAIPYKQVANSHTSETRISERQSRLSLLVQGNITPNTHVAGYYEMDFLGAAPTANQNESNSFTPRTRVVYATLDWDNLGLHLLGGDAWSLLTMNSKGITPRTEVLPPTIDAQYVPGFTWTRQNQLRIVKDWNQTWWLGLSLENPQTTFASNPIPAGLTYNAPGGSGYAATNNVSLNNVPDVIVKGAVDPGFGHYELFGISREFMSRFGGSNTSVHGGGWGLGMMLPVVPKILDFQFTGMTGKGIGRYGSAQLSDVTFKPDGTLSPIKETMLLAGLTLHPTTDLDIYAFAGQERQQKDAFFSATGAPFGYGNPLYVNSGCDIEASPLTCAGNTRKIAQQTLGFWWRFYQGKFGRVQFGAQYSHTTRDAFNGIGGEPSASDNMFFTSLRYYPF
jgi:hypothetical protein